MKTLYLFLLFLIISVPFLNAQETDTWFAFNNTDEFYPSVIDMSHWLDSPAGKHGHVDMKDGQFVFADGTPVQFWGVNICSSYPYSHAEIVDRWVAYLSKYGVNAVRFHKFSSHGLAYGSSTTLDEKMQDRLDYFSNALRKKGIYYGWSHIYGHKPKRTERNRLVAYDEIAGLRYPWSHLDSSTSALINFAPDLQQLSIELTVNMLNHRNPYTGLRYADDPALAFIEFQNEDNIFWSAIERALEQAPTYRAMLNQQFSDWLLEKYGSQSALVQAWGEDALQPGESLELRNIYPKPNHSWFQAEFETAAEEERPIKQHYLDRARFLYETQMKFYIRFVKAVRATGYKGPLVGSCWQAGIGITHFYNLHADALVGIVDRHNYFGGGTGHGLQPGNVNNSAMVRSPGSGLLSTGLQAVFNRPFAFSEWMSLIPNEWTAEAAPIIAAYGLGLQGWDASYAFASNQPGITSTIQTERGGVYNVDSPLHITLYPTLARMLYRNDLREGDPVAVLPVHVPSLAEGKLGFQSSVEQDYDFKSFGGAVPQQALAAGKVGVLFTEEYTEMPEPIMEPYDDRDEQVIRSNTQQLEWHYGEQDYFTINTAGSKGVVGFAGDITHTLGDVTITIDNPFAVVLVTSLDQDMPIERARHILVTTVARARNTGMQYNDDKTELLEVGEAPTLMEPVVVSIEIERSGSPTVYVLDHIGQRTGEIIEPQDGTIVLDGTQHQTVYYEFEY